MRRRRRHLEVSTFPFLAVLLCTMGSLILLLLVLDRRAKIVALNKAKSNWELVKTEKDRRQQERQRQQADAERLAQERQAEWDQRSQQLHAMLLQQEQDLLNQIQQVRDKMAVADTQLQAEQTRAGEQQNALTVAKARLLGLQQTVQSEQNAAAKEKENTAAVQRELERQTLALAQLEQTLANLKALRERQKNTYSVVPYLGRRGDNRKPLYVECAAAGVIVHPDRLALEGMQFTSERLRAEVEKRIGPQQTPSPRPYLLMLVRPEGITQYYRTQEALAGMQIEFGYEFIESDWALDFSSDNDSGAAHPWTTAAKLPLPQSHVPPPSQPRGPGGGSSPMGGMGPNGSNDSQNNVTAKGTRPAVGAAGVERSDTPASTVDRGFAALSPGHPGTVPSVGTGPGGGRVSPPFGNPLQFGGSQQTGAAPSGGATGANEAKEKMTAGAEAASNGVLLGPPTSGNGKAAAAPLGRILGNRDWPIFIECNADGVVLKQGNQKYPMESLTVANNGEHPFAQAVKQAIERRQSTVRPGEPPYRPVIHFQVRPNGMRAYYLAYPLLEALRVPMVRENAEGKQP